MEKKILLAVDDTVHTRNAMEYAVKMSSEVTNLYFTLFYGQPMISQFLMEEADKDSKAKAELKKIVRKNQDDAVKVLEKLKNHMVRMGIPEDRIDSSTQARVLGLAKDIMDKAQQGLYDSIVVGRRGLSKIQRAVMGSVTANLIEHATFIPVWVVDGKVVSSNIMLAVDGSDSSLRAVDHLSFMVGENPHIKITLFHVETAMGNHCVVDFGDKENAPEDIVQRGAKGCIDRFYAHALKKFKSAGVEESRIDIKVSKRSVYVGRAIINEAKKGNYGTIVIGRRGQNKAFFMGSVSRNVIEKASDRALWVVS